MSKVNTNSDGTIPIQILNQLNEHTAGGFILFYYNSEDGVPEQVMTFDSPAHCLGLQKHITDWTKAIEDLSVQSEKISLIASQEAENQAEEEEDEDGLGLT